MDLCPILIHTSVKLVTYFQSSALLSGGHFNPHEREARDGAHAVREVSRRDFNPHEREARDGAHAVREVSRRDFNPHEREARDI